MEKLQVNIILEILGKPSQNVQSALSSLVQRIGNEKGIEILEQTLHEPLPLKEKPDLFTAFAEIMLNLDSFDQYFGIIFAYLPSHIELISPESIVLKNADLNTLANKLVLRLHDYDSITKKALIDKDLLVQRIKEIASRQQDQQPAISVKKTSSSVKKVKRKPKPSSQ